MLTCAFGCRSRTRGPGHPLTAACASHPLKGQGCRLLHSLPSIPSASSHSGQHPGMWIFPPLPAARLHPGGTGSCRAQPGGRSIFVLMRSELCGEPILSAVPAEAPCARAPGDPPAPPPPSHQPGSEPRALLALLQGALERSPRRYLATLLSQLLQSSPASLPAGASREVESLWPPSPPWSSTSIKSVYPSGLPPAPHPSQQHF